MTAATLVRVLECARTRCPCHATARRGQGLTHCPLHDDRRPSFNVAERDGTLLVRCHGNCDQQDAFRRSLELMDDEQMARREVAAYDYTDEAGQLLFQVVRYSPKSFKQRRPDGAGGWIWNLDSTRRVLYWLPEVVQAASSRATVYVCEGEKDVDAARVAGAIATCNPGGAGKWRDEYSTCLQGARAIVVQDLDVAGAAHAAHVVRSLRAVAVPVTLLCPARGKDLSDHLAAGLSLTELIEAESTMPAEPRTLALPLPGAPEPGKCVRCGVEAVCCGSSPSLTFCYRHRPADMPGQVWHA